MFHESTELLWIGCLTGSTWTPRSKSVTLTPNINSQISCPKGIARDEWNNLLHLFNISHFSSTCCAKDSSLISCPTMAKRIQEQKEEERIASKSKPTAMNLSSIVPTSSSSATSPIASKSPRMPMRINPNSFDAASTSQVRLQDAYLGGLMETATERPVASGEESGDMDNSEAEIWYCKGKKLRGNPLPIKIKLGRNPCIQFFSW